MPKAKQNPAEYIIPLNMNGLQGRMMHMPAPSGKKRDILLIYGTHSSLERWFGLAQVFNRYGSVTMPDLPGFGGMQSFYRIGEKPSIDRMADYLAAFVKMHYKRKRLTIVGMSFGFVVATRMLQRFPELNKKVDIMISLVGFAHKDDFIFTPVRYWFYRFTANLFSLPLTCNLFRAIALHPFILKMVYAKTHNAKRKFESLTDEDSARMMDIEIWLWRNNDVRTYMYTAKEFLKLDNCSKQIDLPLWNVSVNNDHFLDNDLVEQHLQIIFNELHSIKISGLMNHAPTVIANAKDAAPFIPQQLRKKLAEQ